MSSVVEIIESRIRRALSAIRWPFRARLTALDGQPGVQLAQGKALAGEQMQAVELMQQFGFTSGVPADSQLIVLPLAGRTSASVIVATENGAFRVQVGSGETCVYNQWGAKVTLKEEKIVEVECDYFVVKAKESITMDTKSYTVTAADGVTYQTPTYALGPSQDGDGGCAATLNANMGIQGDISQQGSHTSSGDQVAGGISQVNHTHTGVMPGSGTTGKPS